MPVPSIDVDAAVRGRFALQVVCRLSAVFALLLLTSCAVIKPMPDSELQPYKTETTWYRAGPGPICGTALVVHGLNNRPEVMEPIIRILNEIGYDALLVTLRGHRGSASELASTTPDDWVSDIKSGFDRIQTERRGEKTVVLGFSLGAIAALELTKREPERFLHSKIDRSIFFAPPIMLSLRTSLIRFLIPGRYFNLALPSLSPVEYRAHNITPLAAYDSAFTLVRSIAGEPGPIARSTPTTIFVSPKDEMVSSAGLRRWISQKGLTDWNLEVLNPVSSVQPMYNHLIIDQTSLGAAAWLKLKAGLAQMLSCR